MSLFKVNSLSFEYQSTSFIIDNLSFEIPEKSFVSIIGRNGSGKSTVVKLLSGIYSNYSGDIFYDNQMLTDYSPKDLAKRIAYLPQNNYLSEINLNVIDFLTLGRYSYRAFLQYKIFAEDLLIVESAMEILDIQNLKEKKISQLSGGEKQKVMIALGLVQLDCTEKMSGKTLILDEPLTHLDLHYQFEIFNVLCKLINEKGLTVIAVIHDLNIALKFTTDSILMENGKIIEQGNTQDIITENTLKKYFKLSSQIISSGDDFHLNIIQNDGLQ